MTEEENIELDQEDSDYEDAENRAEINAEVAESYGAPEFDEKTNQFTIIKKAISAKDSLRTTYLSKGELGRPMCSTRFYIDVSKLCKIYNAPMVERYFRNKSATITDSGMSNEGFTMKLNVTSRRDVNRKNVKKTDSVDQRGES